MIFASVIDAPDGDALTVSLLCGGRWICREIEGKVREAETTDANQLAVVSPCSVPLNAWGAEGRKVNSKRFPSELRATTKQSVIK